MKLTKTCACSICDTPLKWWNTQSCIHCKEAICKKHTRNLRRSRSSVIFSLCTNCALEAVRRRTLIQSSQTGELQRVTKSLPKMSLSGFSFSGISFSGFSFSGISFSGIKEEKPESSTQPDPTDDTDQKRQSDTIPEADEPEKNLVRQGKD